MSSFQNLPYRLGVGITLFNNEGLVWVGRRIDTKNAWQMPQGGIEDDDSPAEAALRELEEEVGTANAELMAETRDWLTYDLPPPVLRRTWRGRFRGQKQKWFAARFLGDESEIDLNAHHSPEFEEWKWVPLQTLPRLIVRFKRPLYEQVVEEFAPIAERLAAAKE